MSVIDYHKREINYKIVHYGVPMAGKCFSLDLIHASVPPELRGKRVRSSYISGGTKNIESFDFKLPKLSPELKVFSRRFYLYTINGSVFYDYIRTKILEDVDGIVFVVDSQVERMEYNSEMLQRLDEGLKEHGYDINTIPLVFQYNKRNYPNAASVEDIRKVLNLGKRPEFEAIVSNEFGEIEGQGVLDALKTVIKLILYTPPPKKTEVIC